MKKLLLSGVCALSLMAGAAGSSIAADGHDGHEFTGLKAEAVAGVEKRSKLVQEIVDQLFSYSELGFQEFETRAYMTNLLEKNGFDVEQGVSGMPTAWWASWGSGEPVIALGSDIDGIPRSSQMPGVGYRQPIVEGAPGHGEGHNSGQGVIVAAALAVKELMEREGMKGTLVIWPGVAEELVGAKAYYARDGKFKDVDAVIFTHVSSRFSTTWGGMRGTGLVSAEYTFNGTAAHGAGDPWKGRSALDAVELMNVGWNFKREHLHPLQRSHYVVSYGGDQPNVVPSKASVWYFIREMTAENIRANFDALENMAKGAALMTGTDYERSIVGSAWPRHFNKPLAEAMQKNIETVGMPNWDEKDHTFAKGVQALMGQKDPQGLITEVSDLLGPPDQPQSGGSDDIGDVSWSVPTITLRFPSNVSGITGHHWSSAMSMATPVAHKGAVAGAKATAATIIDLLTNDQLMKDIKDYFNNEQLKDTKYEPFISATDKPAIHKNREIMATYKDELKKYYYDSSKYDTLLDQLGVNYPQVKKPQ